MEPDLLFYNQADRKKHAHFIHFFELRHKKWIGKYQYKKTNSIFFASTLPKPHKPILYQCFGKELAK
jgi:hypothetical protein